MRNCLIIALMIVLAPFAIAATYYFTHYGTGIISHGAYVQRERSGLIYILSKSSALEMPYGWPNEREFNEASMVPFMSSGGTQFVQYPEIDEDLTEMDPPEVNYFGLCGPYIIPSTYWRHYSIEGRSIRSIVNEHCPGFSVPAGTLQWQDVQLPVSILDQVE